jgi:FKBP-type peptidyl-prolyl cis-trans isomerase
MAGASMCMALAACQTPSTSGAAAAPEPALDSIKFAPVVEVDLSRFTRTRSGAYYRDVLAGHGTAAGTDRVVTLKYVISLPNGTVVETQNTPMDLTIGPDLIRGLREGLVGMQAGGIRRIVVPPSLGYGREVHGAIPPQSTLVFEVEMVSVK